MNFSIWNNSRFIIFNTFGCIWKLLLWIFIDNRTNFCETFKHFALNCSSVDLLRLTFQPTIVHFDLFPFSFFTFTHKVSFILVWFCWWFSYSVNSNPSILFFWLCYVSEGYWIFLGIVSYIERSYRVHFAFVSFYYLIYSVSMRFS